MTTLDETFVRDFTCDRLDELPPGRLPRFYYPGGTAVGGRDGLIVQVCPRASDSWVGIFGFGDLLSKGKNGLYTWPDPRILCVVARAQGYIVQVGDPSKYEVLNVHPVLDVIPIRSKRLVVFANYTELVAYGESGVVWVSDRLSWDGFTVSGVTDEHIKGKAWDPGVEEIKDFRVDLMDGHREDGE